MKFRRLGSMVLAAALMASTSAIVAYADSNLVSAADSPDWSADKKFLYIRLVTNSDEKGIYDAINENVMNVGGVRFTVSGKSWSTGAVVFNSNSTGWKQLDFGKGATVTWEDDNGDEDIKGVIEYKADGSVFADTDEYCQVALGMWNDITSIDKIEILDKSGNAIWILNRDGDKYVTELEPAAPVVEEAPAEEETKEEEKAEETKEEIKEEEPKEEETKKEDTKKDDTKKEDKKDDTKKDDTKKDDTKKDEKKEEVLSLADCYLETNNTVILVGENGENAYATANDIDIKTVYGYRVTVEVDPDNYDDEEVWFGGGIGANSNSTGWLQNEWGKSDKDYILDVDDDYIGTVEWLNTKPIFSADDKYAQLWFSVWSEPEDVTVKKVEVLGKKGKVIAEAEIIAAEADEEETAADVAEDEAEDLDFEDDLEDDADEVDEDAAEEEEVDRSAVDWSAYDKDAADAQNSVVELKAGVNSLIDVYAVLGDDFDKLAKVYVTSKWTPGTAWCAGGGIGYGAITADGSEWIQGIEIGAANANEGVVNDGEATQLLLDLTDNPIALIASLGEDGKSNFGQIQIGDWWNSETANAQITAITFKDADDNVLAELTYEAAASIDADAEEAAEEEETAPAQEEAAPVPVVTETKKDNSNPKTGVAGLAAAVMLALSSAGTAFLSRKRK